MKQIERILSVRKEEESLEPLQPTFLRYQKPPFSPLELGD